MRESRKERTKKFIVAVGIQEGVFSLFNKINYFTLFMFVFCSLFLYKKYPYQTPNFVFSILKECYENMLLNTFFFFFFCIMSTQKTCFSTLFKSQFLHCSKNQNYNTLIKWALSNKSTVTNFFPHNIIKTTNYK